jgi:hypothetical protein
MRYTNEQRNLAEGMEILLKLYYRLKETDKKDWLTDSMVQLVGECAYKVIPTFKKCLYIKSPDHPRLKFYSPEGGVMNISKKDFRIFVYAMDAFIEERKIEIITVEGISHEFKRENYSRLRQKVIENVAIPKEVYRDSANFRFQSFTPGVRDEVSGEGHYNGLVSHPIYRETIHFHTSEESAFAKTLYSEGSAYGAEITPPLKTKHKNNFHDLLQYFFVKYIDVFESFDRIDLCDYKPCGKLVYKIRYGKRKFCCDKCKTDNHKASQDNDKRLCRGSHNKWIDRIAMNKPQRAQHVYKAEHCDIECELPIGKREVCEHMIDKKTKHCDVNCEQPIEIKEVCDHMIGKKKVCPTLYELNKELCDAYKEIKENKLPKKRRHKDLEFDIHLRKSKRIRKSKRK